jgi:hypothetical protein
MLALKNPESMSIAGINRILHGANKGKTRRITIISPIQKRKIIITRLSGIPCPECQEHYPDD